MSPKSFSELVEEFYKEIWSLYRFEMGCEGTILIKLFLVVLGLSEEMPDFTESLSDCLLIWKIEILFFSSFL